MEWVIFGFLALWLLASVFGVLFLKNPVHVILAFLSVILAIAGMFLQLGAELLAGLQLIIYAVAIIVFYVLVITTIPWEKVKKFGGIYKKEALFAMPFLLVSFGAVSYMVLSGGFYVPKRVIKESNVAGVGKALFTNYLFPFEVASVILLIAMIGAIILGRKEE